MKGPPGAKRGPLDRAPAQSDLDELLNPQSTEEVKALVAALKRIYDLAPSIGWRDYELERNRAEGAAWARRCLAVS